MSKADYAEAAFQIGARLARDALWHEGRCNWFGPVLDDYGSNASLGWGTLGPSLYEGTAGIGLFLARLAKHCGDSLFAATAAGAFEHALDRSEDVPAPVRRGFYTGGIGIGYAALEAAKCLGEPSLGERGLALVADAAGLSADGPNPSDFMSGHAGAIPVLLQLAAAHDMPALAEAAHLRAEALLATSVRSARGLSWDTLGEMAGMVESIGLPNGVAESLNAMGPVHLTGLSHGAGGIALALLEAGQAFSDVRFSASAAAGFAYEDSWFDEAGDHWPDLRFHGSDGDARRPCAWCHGAIGIGLARRRAYRLTADPHHLEMAKAALAIAAAALPIRLRTEDDDFSPCHGLAGDADLFIEWAAEEAGAEAAEAAALVEQVAQLGIETYSRSGRPWPCGVPGAAESPSLMTGMAGTGYFYLRAADPRIPSILLVEGQE